ncbi:MAG: TonB-dependent receptor, partial [Muribaculaceae bacterium]|nr:TonB-dependent receptor [Muribaculaceae bacterium]
SESFQRMYQFTYTNTAEYQFDIADKHHFTVLVGQESIIYKQNQFGVSTDGMTDERLMLLGNATKPITLSDISQAISEMTMNSFFGTLNYDYEGRYIFDGSIRRDGSSKFATGHRWSTFYSLGVAWNAKNEKFLQDVKWLSDAKIRLSYGTAGNSGVGYYDWQGTLSGSGIYDGNPVLGVSSASNHLLSWETVKGWDLGLNFGIYNRLNVELDFYTKKTCDMLLSVPWSATTGFASGVANMGNMTNKGFEATFNATLFQNKDWLWTARVNFAYNKNEITSLFNGKDSYVINNTGTILEVGKPYGSNYAVRYAGVDPADGKQMWYDKDRNLKKVFN